MANSKVKKFKISLVIKDVLTQWVYLEYPDTKWNKDGVYRVEGIIAPSNPIVKQVREQLMPKAMEYVKEANPNVKNIIPIEPFTELDDGSYQIKAKTNAIFRFTDSMGQERIKENVVRVFDRNVKPLSASEIHRGDTVNLQVTAIPYYMPASRGYGISFRLAAVQLVKKGDGLDSGVLFEAIGSPEMESLDTMFEMFQGDSEGDF